MSYSWWQIKLFVEQASAVHMDALHVLFGVVAQLAIALITGKSVNRWLPWAAILLLAIVNELGDLWLDQWPDWGTQYGEGLKDLVLTMLLPTLMLIIARRRPSVLIHCDKRSPVEFVP